MKLSIVIVSYNTRRLLKACLESIRHNSPTYEYQVVVVDNDSRDGSAELVREEYKDVLLIESRENVGFAGASNRAIRRTQGDYVLLLNSDTIVSPGAIDELCAFADTHSEAAVVGAGLVYPDGRAQASSGAFPNLVTIFARYFRLKELVPFEKRAELYRLASGILGRTIGGYLANYAQTMTPQVVDRVPGTCMLVRRLAIEEVGYLDEGYFMYVEDVDWCYRFRLAGWQVYHLPYVKIVHLVGQSASDQASRARVHSARIRSQLRYFRKHHSRMKLFLVRLIITTSLAATTVRQLLLSERTLGDVVSSWRKLMFTVWRAQTL